MDNALKEKLLTKSTWHRGLFMLLFFVVKYTVSWLITLITLYQFGSNLWTGKPNEKLLHFTSSLNAYFLQVISFLTFNTESKPFPFMNWPQN